MSAGNSTYSPLPQSNSDSDGSSEEELHVSQGNRITNRIPKIHNPKSDKAQNDAKQNVINYKPLDNDGDVGIALNKFHSNPDEVSILKPYGNIEIFSTSRKICFIFSLMLCVFTTIAFIWILPCNVGTCPSSSDIKIYNFTWEETLSNLEIYGPSNWEPDQGGNYNLVFLTRSDIDYPKNYSGSVLWCLKGKDGSQNWQLKLNKDPNDVDCKLIDVNDDGANDCLIFGTNSLKAINSASAGALSFQMNQIKKLEVINQNVKAMLMFLRNIGGSTHADLQNDYKRVTVKHSFDGSIQTLPKTLELYTGKELWDIQKSNRKKVAFYFKSFPLIIPDVDNDKINELLLLCSSADDKENHPSNNVRNGVIIVSGKTGSIITKPWQINLCSSVYNLTLEPSSTLSYTCESSDGKESLQKVSLTEVCQSLKNSSKERLNLQTLGILNQHSPDSNVVYVNDFKLQIVNQGNCPENCNVLVDIKSERGNGKTVHSFNELNTYGMAPVAFKTERESGFIVKFWKWCSKKEKSETQSDFSPQEIVIHNFPKNIKKRSKKLNLLPNMSAVLDNEMLLESEREFQRKKRTANRMHKSGISALRNGNFNIHLICETVVKMTLNESHILLSNLVKDKIIQICKKPKICQPDAYEHRHSVLIGQTDEAGVKLITFTSTYVHKKESNQKGEPWKLQSNVSVLNL